MIPRGRRSPFSTRNEAPRGPELARLRSEHEKRSSFFNKSVKTDPDPWDMPFPGKDEPIVAEKKSDQLPKEIVIPRSEPPRQRRSKERGETPTSLRTAREIQRKFFLFQESAHNDPEEAREWEQSVAEAETVIQALLKKEKNNSEAHAIADRWMRDAIRRGDSKEQARIVIILRDL